MVLLSVHILALPGFIFLKTKSKVCQAFQKNTSWVASQSPLYKLRNKWGGEYHSWTTLQNSGPIIQLFHPLTHDGNEWLNVNTDILLSRVLNSKHKHALHCELNHLYLWNAGSMPRPLQSVLCKLLANSTIQPCLPGGSSLSYKAKLIITKSIRQYLCFLSQPYNVNNLEIDQSLALFLVTTVITKVKSACLRMVDFISFW